MIEQKFKASAATRRRVLEVFVGLPAGQSLSLRQVRQALPAVAESTILGAANDLLDIGALALANPNRRQTTPKLLNRGKHFAAAMADCGSVPSPVAASCVVASAIRQRSEIETAWWPQLNAGEVA